MLDPKSRREILQIIQDLHQHTTDPPITTIFITQFPEEALETDRLIILEKGTIAFDDHPKIVFQNVEKLKSIGLDVPVEFEIMPLLLKKGYSLDLLNDFH